MIVVFHTTGAYTYDVTADVFVEMAERAYYTDEYDETPFQWYDENMVECVKDEVSDSDGPLYTDKLNL